MDEIIVLNEAIDKINYEINEIINNGRGKKIFVDSKYSIPEKDYKKFRRLQHDLRDLENQKKKLEIDYYITNIEKLKKDAIAITDNNEIKKIIYNLSKEQIESAIQQSKFSPEIAISFFARDVAINQKMPVYSIYNLTDGEIMDLKQRAKVSVDPGTVVIIEYLTRKEVLEILNKYDYGYMNRPASIAFGAREKLFNLYKKPIVALTDSDLLALKEDAKFKGINKEKIELMSIEDIRTAIKTYSNIDRYSAILYKTFELNPGKENISSINDNISNNLMPSEDAYSLKETAINSSTSIEEKEIIENMSEDDIIDITKNKISINDKIKSIKEKANSIRNKININDKIKLLKEKSHQIKEKAKDKTNILTDKLSQLKSKKESIKLKITKVRKPKSLKKIKEALKNNKKRIIKAIELIAVAAVLGISAKFLVNNNKQSPVIDNSPTVESTIDYNDLHKPLFETINEYLNEINDDNSSDEVIEENTVTEEAENIEDESQENIEDVKNDEQSNTQLDTETNLYSINIGTSVYLKEGFKVFGTAADALKGQNSMNPYFNNSNDQRAVLGVLIKYNNNFEKIFACDDNAQDKITNYINNGGQIVGILTGDMVQHPELSNYDGSKVTATFINSNSDGWVNINNVDSITQIQGKGHSR